MQELIGKYFIIHGVRLHHHIGNFEDEPHITTDYIVLLSYIVPITDKRKRQLEEFYELTFSNEYGHCWSGYCSATWGSISYRKVGSIKDIHYKPKWAKENMIAFFTGDSEYGKLQLVMQPEIPLFESTGDGCDEYYPSGESYFNKELFEKTERCIDKMRVYILVGASGLGKSYIGNMINIDGNVFETDSCQELPSLLQSNFVILGKKHGFTVDEVIDKYKIKDEIDFIIINLFKY